MFLGLPSQWRVVLGAVILELLKIDLIVSTHTEVLVSFPEFVLVLPYNKCCPFHASFRAIERGKNMLLTT